MREERHVVRRLQERILQRDARLVAVEQVETPDIQRRHVELADRIELGVAAALHNRAKMRRHGNPPLRVDPVDCVRQKPVHHPIQPLPPPRPSWSSSPRLQSAAPAAGPPRVKAKRSRAAQPHICRFRENSYAYQERSFECRYGISWGNMGVNGSKLSKPFGDPLKGRSDGIPLLSSIKPNEAFSHRFCSISPEAEFRKSKPPKHPPSPLRHGGAELSVPHRPMAPKQS